ncbi:HD domain-containing protein [bacterium]|nr:HD domain-containing protein [bacterium]
MPTLQNTPSLHTVRSLPANDSVQGFYLLIKIESRPKKSGELFLSCELQDYSGKIEAKMWENISEPLAELKPGDAVYVSARVDHFNNIPSLVLAQLRKATETEVPDRRQFLPHSALSANEANEKLARVIESVKHPALHQLLDTIFSDVKFRKGFLEAPGGKMWHHSTLGGLAEHTLSMIGLADLICSHYPEFHRDLLISGALLHDIGKVFELQTEVGIDYTVEGRLLGHITQGVLWIEKQIESISDFSPELRRQLLHLILSHQGDGTMGSPVKPMTREALALHYLDELDSRMSAFAQVQAKTPEDQNFSDYVRLMDRFFYFRNPDIEETSK